MKSEIVKDHAVCFVVVDQRLDVIVETVLCPLVDRAVMGGISTYIGIGNLKQTSVDSGVAAYGKIKASLSQHDIYGFRQL